MVFSKLIVSLMELSFYWSLRLPRIFDQFLHLKRLKMIFFFSLNSMTLWKRSSGKSDILLFSLRWDYLWLLMLVLLWCQLCWENVCKGCWQANGNTGKDQQNGWLWSWWRHWTLWGWPPKIWLLYLLSKSIYIHRISHISSLHRK